MARFCLLGVAVFLLGSMALAGAPVNGSQIHWKKTTIDKHFRAEGVAVADVNRDGKLDILAGEVWYEAPNWKMHEIRTPGNYGDGAHGYSHCFAAWADDINGDGYPDLIVIDFPGAPCHWYENPQGKDVHWKEHKICNSACNETPQYADLFGNGQRVLIMASQPTGKENEGEMCWYQAGKDPTRPWQKHSISGPSTPGHVIPGTFRFSHGLGVGDVNGDGRLDVICTGGWWQQPAHDTGKPWKFHPANLGNENADMVTYDVNGDGKNDIIGSCAHHYGIWWWEQKAGRDHNPIFVQHELFPHLFSESHALHCVDINGDGQKDLVTGKRWWAHGPDGDVDPNAPAVLYWFEAKRDKNGMTKFTPHKVDHDSGIGTQFAVTDVNGDGLLDIVIANKKGVFLFEQERPTQVQSRKR